MISFYEKLKNLIKKLYKFKKTKNEKILKQVKGNKKSLLTLRTMLEKGYFPQELPPVFNTKNFANFAVTTKSEPFGKSTLSIKYRLARPGQLPRMLQLVNPESYILLSKYICDNWSKIASIISLNNKKARILSHPDPAKTDRALSRKYKFSSHKYVKLHQRTCNKVILKTDISKFYPSVYTHSIPWCIDGKGKAKTKEYRDDKKKLANKLDELIRNCQSQETKGIPIGPDASFLLGEIIMSYVDKKLSQTPYNKYSRNTDDFEFILDTIGDAEKVIATLSEILSEIGLELNQEKTEVINIPAPLNNEWVSILLRHDLDKNSKSDALVNFFDDAFRFSHKFPTEAVLKFALSVALRKIQNFNNTSPNTLLEFALQSSLSEAGCLKHCIQIIQKCEEVDFINYEKIKFTLEKIIDKHAPLNHSSEVCWALWAITQTGEYYISNDTTPILSQETLNKLLKSTDCCTMVLAMHLHEKFKIFDGLMVPNHPWLNILNNPDDYDEYWLFWYEGITRSWAKTSAKIPEKYAVLKKASKQKISFLT